MTRGTPWCIVEVCPIARDLVRPERDGPMTAKKRPTRRPQHKPSSASRLPQLPTSATLVYTEYDITDEPLDNRDIKKLPSQVQARIDDLYELAQRDPRQAIPELERLVTTYPHIPTFANHLSIAKSCADTVDVHSAAERSPPAIGPPCHPDPDPVARATLAAVLALRPAMSAHSAWNRASASSWNAEPLSSEHECISGFPRTTSSMTTRAASVSGWDRGENRTK
jgi:hypothetical protein